MANDDVIERADNWFRGRTDVLGSPFSSPARDNEIRMVGDLLAEVRNLRDKLDSEANHRLSLCSDNERFVAELRASRARVAEITGEATAKRVVEAVLSDLTGRRGIRQAFDDIDDDVREELEETLADVVRAALSAEDGREKGGE